MAHISFKRQIHRAFDKDKANPMPICEKHAFFAGKHKNNQNLVDLYLRLCFIRLQQLAFKPFLS